MCGSLLLVTGLAAAATAAPAAPREVEIRTCWSPLSCTPKHADDYRSTQ